MVSAADSDKEFHCRDLPISSSAKLAGEIVARGSGLWEMGQ
jgi:hypothetical protein